MQIPEMLERLERAQAEIRAVEESLNDTAHACAACGLTIREDFTQYQMRLQLEACRRKLRRFVESLRSRLTASHTHPV